LSIVHVYLSLCLQTVSHSNANELIKNFSKKNLTSPSVTRVGDYRMMPSRGQLKTIREKYFRVKNFVISFQLIYDIQIVE